MDDYCFTTVFFHVSMPNLPGVPTEIGKIVNGILSYRCLLSLPGRSFGDPPDFLQQQGQKNHNFGLDFKQHSQ